MSKTRFETESCSRCGGGGSYSYCQAHGDTCFKCGGSGITLSKRGLAAKAYLIKITSKPISELKIGDKVQMNRHNTGSYIGTVVAIELDGIKGTSTTYENGVATVTHHVHTDLTIDNVKYGRSSYSASPDHVMRVFGADSEAKLAEALAYQETLTKQGKPRKVNK